MPINLTTIRQCPTVSEIRFLTKEREQTLYVSQWLWARQTVHLLDAITQLQRSTNVQNKRHSPHVRTANFSTTQKLSIDKWGFGWAWESIIRDFQTEESLYASILKRRQQIVECRESWRNYIQKQQSLDPFYYRLEKLTGSPSAIGTHQVSADQMTLSTEGISGTYFLSDREGTKRFVIKPIDEDIDCLNNGKGFSSPYTSSTIRDNITLYRSAMRETLSYEIGKNLGVVPHTALAILDCSAFNDQIDQLLPDERVRYEQFIGCHNLEKLCSVQEFIPNSKTLFEGLQDLQAAGLSDDEIEARIDQRDFENANILQWLTYDTDGHLNNFLVYHKSTDSIGNEILGIKKIDNGLAFPEKNEQLRNNLRYLPNANCLLSEEGRTQIAELSIEQLTEQMKQFGLDESVDALRQRVDVLKQLAERQDLTLYEIDYRMSLIGKQNGIQLALSQVSQNALEQMVKEVVK